MSESKNIKLSPLEVVERYYEKYLEYEKAFNRESENSNVQKELMEVAESGIDLNSEEFNSKMIDLVIERPQKISDVNNAAAKFVLFADFYIMTQKDPLPKNILEDYEKLPIRDSFKTYFSIENGDFVRNKEEKVSDEMKEYFKAIIKQLNTQ